MAGYIADFLKVCRDNISVLLTGDYKVGETDLNDLGNLALFRLGRTVTPFSKELPELSPEQKAAVKKLYGPYIMFMSDRYHRLYTSKTGRFSPRFIPEDLYALCLDRFYSDRAEAKYLDNKCYYYRLFSNIKQPELVAMRIGGTWLDGDCEPVPKSAVPELVAREREVVLKQAVNSECGFGVKFLSGDNIKDDFISAMRDVPRDAVIQRPVKQHPDLAALHPQSVNTMRIVSLMTEEKVKVYAVSLRIGRGDSRMDNGCQGGIYCGVLPDGSLRDYGVLDDGTVLRRHPDLGYAFEGKRVPCLKKAVALVKKAHAFMGHFRLVSWDVAIDESGEAVLIEANLSLGGINDVQMSCGPLFGKDAEKILEEAVNGKRKVNVLL